MRDRIGEQLMALPSDTTPVFFVSVSDRERALAFYQDKLGVTLRSADEHGAFLDLGGALLRVTPMAGHEPSPHPVLGWNVDDIDAAAAALRGTGIEFIIYDGFGQDERGIWTSPDGGTKVAWFADPDGNVLSLSQT